MILSFSAIFLNLFEAFRIAQNTNNSTYLEKIEKDIEDKVNIIAEAAATDSKKPPSGTEKSNDKKISTVDDIEIHTEADDPDKPKSNVKTEIHTENDITDKGNEKDPTNKPPKFRHEERTQRVEVLGPVIELKKPSDENGQTEINKEIVVTGKPKLNGKVTIDTTFQYKHPHMTENKENGEHKEKLAGFRIDNVVAAKSPSNPTSADMRLKTTTHTRQHKAYHDYSVAHKVLNSNIEKLKNVLKAIEGAPANSKTNEQGIEVVKKKSGRLGALSGKKQQLNKNEASLQLSGTPQVVNIIPPYLPQAPSGYKVLKSQSSTQTTVSKLPGPPVTQQPARNIVSANTSPVLNSTVTVTPLQTATPSGLQTARANQVQLPQTSGVPLRVKDAFPQASAPGLHVVQGNGNPPNDQASTQNSADVFDHLASELVDHDAASHTTNHAANNGAGKDVSNWVNQLHPRNDSLQETFKELSPEESAKICKLVFWL